MQVRTPERLDGGRVSGHFCITVTVQILYYAFGIRGYDYVKTDYRVGGVVFTIHRRPHTYRCPLCGSRRVASRGCQERTFRAVLVGGKPVLVVLPIPRVECSTCQVIRQAPLDFAEPGPQEEGAGAAGGRGRGMRIVTADDDDVSCGSFGRLTHEHFRRAQDWRGQMNMQVAVREKRGHAASACPGDVPNRARDDSTYGLPAG
jgi:hypothetical protein